MTARHVCTFVVLALFVPTLAIAQLKDARVADYEQWRLAQKSGAVADPAAIAVLPGFQIELVRVARPDEGSWISLAFDPRGRMVIGREDKGLLRLTLADDGRTVAGVETINDTLLECRGILFAHDSLYVHANNSKGLYRLRDTDGDDRFDEVRLLRKTEGGVGHGRNGLALGPDGMIYLAMGNNVTVGDEVDAGSPYRNYSVDRLLPCAWNEFLFDSDVVPPCGHIVRTDADGKKWELFAGGFRNPYGVAFNRDSQLFTYDADMEWDAGAPWYRPTCVMHVVSGGEYGWRQETNCWPDHYADSLPHINIGLGSPTGVKFGQNSRFPGKYREALFILDWAYGRIIAVHLQPRGGSYTGTPETFVKGKPLNVTDLDFGPDGMMYFVVGGRRTQSALYRVRYDAKQQLPALADPAAGVIAIRARAVRHSLAMFHGTPRTDGLEPAWRHLGTSDPFVRQAARVALERQPVATWQEQALAEREPMAAVTALLALARSAGPELKHRVFSRLVELVASSIDDAPRQILWRTVQVAILRLGRPESAQQRQLIDAMRPIYRGGPRETGEREMLCELLVALEAPGVIADTLSLLDAAPTQEEQLFYLFALRNIDRGWTLAQRERYLQWLKRSESFSGAHYLHRFLTFIRTDALGSLSADERAALAPLIAQLGKSAALPGGKNATRPEVRKWTLEELVPVLDEVGNKRDLDRGRRLFVEAQCARCHRLRGEGLPIGPDLDGVASRFGRRDLLESIIVPSKVVDEKYRNLVIETDAGQVVTGQLAGGDAATLAIAADPLEPAQIQRISRKSIVTRKSSPVSIMPEGLLNTLDQSEIVDLLSYVETVEP